MPAVRAAIALGSNLDDPEAHVKRGFADLALVPETWVVARSSLYRTRPVGYADQPDFVNACALVETRLAPRALLDQLLAIEKRHGRVREIPNGPRTLDLDIVLYEILFFTEQCRRMLQGDAGVKPRPAALR